MQKLVINWHILEKCNFGCNYCFAHWPDSISGPEVWRDMEKSKKLLIALRGLSRFYPEESNDRIRLNIAGGEPMLLWHRGVLQKVLTEAKKLGFDLSIISNGYLINDDVVLALAPQLQILGISMDSTNTQTNKKIGRCGKNNMEKQTTPGRVKEIFRLARSINPRIECKLNTVVNAENHSEDFHDAIARIKPNRWKVFQMLPVADSRDVSEKQQPLKISNVEFQSFLNRHIDLQEIMRPENNDAMTESYLMVNPFGRFYQNQPSEIDCRHVVSDPVDEVGIEKALQQIEFRPRKFQQRYK